MLDVFVVAVTYSVQACTRRRQSEPDLITVVMMAADRVPAFPPAAGDY